MKKVKLISFRYDSSSPTRWRSEKIDFAEEFTLIMGENGTGKTPLLWGMAYALGYPCELAPDISSNVDLVEIDLSIDEEIMKFRRKISDTFSVEVTKDNVVTEFLEERKFSDFLFESLGIQISEITVKMSNGGTRPYIGHFLPLVWVSQSRGWTYLYQPLNNQNFIKDQHEEMMRLIFGLPARHPYDRSRAYNEKKKQLEAAEYLIESRKNAIRSYEVELGELAQKSAKELEKSKNEIRQLLESARDRLKNSKQTTVEVDEAIESCRANLYKTERLLGDTVGKIDGLQIAYKELEGETEILESNELANDEFRSFCGVQHCKIFETAKVSYGKRLLYLKDQLKDIQVTSSSISMERDQLSNEIKTRKEELKYLELHRESVRKDLGILEITSEMEELGQRFAKVDHDWRRLSTLNELRRSFAEKVIEVNSLEESVKALKPGRRSDNSAVTDAVLTFKNSFAKWLKILKTPNIRDVGVDESFSLSINGAPFTVDSYQDGSTRARIVLANFAAILEVGMQDGAHHPGFMFLDTPRQHEVNLDDLRDYFTSLRELLKTKQCQVVIACKDPIFEATQNDLVYEPKFLFGTERRHLGN